MCGSFGCGDTRGRYPAEGSQSGDSGDQQDDGDGDGWSGPDNVDGPPPGDASGLCGNQFFAVTSEPGNLYFVLDKSGSMAYPASAGSSKTKYQAVSQACVSVVAELGNEVNVGAALFPGLSGGDQCGVGEEVFATRRGDEAGTYSGSQGPVTSAFAAAIDVGPLGGTPTAATLESLAPILEALSGKTSVVLATDGGPNCSPTRVCDARECTWNIEHSVGCDLSTNCCDPEKNGDSATTSCLDGAATAMAVAKLRDRGIRTYVVGIPGSEFYVALLDQLAIIGGTARATEPRYYKVEDVGNLKATLLQIGRQAAASCEFELDEAPPDLGYVNVYLDQTLVPFDELDGWSWVNDTTLTLNGASCAKLERGEVGRVQVVAGCPTHIASLEESSW